MKKYKCTNTECHYSCELRSDLFPHKCVCWDHIPKWVAMDGTEPVAESNQLPKLTAEVFDREDCPEWAKWAAVDAGGFAWYYSVKPVKFHTDTWQNICVGTDCHGMPIPGKWDASDWQNSLIERPAKLPEWCKVGAYGYDVNGYFKILEVTDTDVHIRNIGADHGLRILIKHWNIGEVGEKQARLRPYNAEEMKALVGKVIELSKDIFVIHSYGNDTKSVYFNNFRYSSSDLLNDNFSIDGSPCGKLEHLENGEWVE